MDLDFPSLIFLFFFREKSIFCAFFSHLCSQGLRPLVPGGLVLLLVDVGGHPAQVLVVVVLMGETRNLPRKFGNSEMCRVDLHI